MVRKITKWECGLCKSTYNTRADARECQRKEIAPNLPRGTAFREDDDLVILADDSPAITCEHNKRYDGVYVVDNQLTSGGFLLVDTEFTISKNNRHICGAGGYRGRKLNSKEVNNLCRDNSDFAYAFAHVSKGILHMPLLMFLRGRGGK